MRFTATIEQTGRTTTGIRVPDEIVGQLGGGKRPRVVVTLDDGYVLRTTLGSHGGAPFISVAAAVREAAALAEDATADEWFHQLTESQRRTFVTSVTSAKKPETRQRRVTQAVEALAAGQKRP